MAIAELDTPLEDLPLRTLRADLRKAAETLGVREARYLVDLYYQMQDYRKASANQLRALTENEEPGLILRWSSDSMESMEATIKTVLDSWTNREPSGMGKWAKGIYGIGPVISAGLLAHLDITKAPTVGHIWRFAGLDPTLVWEKGQKRPYNANLKVLCWKIGQSFMKFHNRDECFYGHIYAERKAYEIARNERGENAELAKSELEKKNYGRDTNARKAYEAGKLPDGRIDARARRYATKLFLAHWHEEAYRRHFKTEPPAPYPIAHLGHAHKIDAPAVPA